MEILESNLSREGVEALDWVRDPIHFEERQIARIYQYSLAGGAGIGITVAGALTLSCSRMMVAGVSMMVVGVLTMVASTILLIGEGFDLRREEPALALWQLRKDEGMVQTEVEQLKKRIEEIKNSSYTGSTTAWFLDRVDLSQQIRGSAISRDEQWKALCDDLASAAARVGRLSIQSERGHNFRSYLLNKIQKSVEHLEMVSKDATWGSAWVVLLKEKHEIAYLLSWVTRSAPEITGCPASAFYDRMAHRDSSFLDSIDKEGIVTAIKKRILDIDQQRTNLFNCYKVRLDTLIESAL